MPGNGNSGGGGNKGGDADGPLTIYGNRKDNTLTGGAHADSIWGREGDDTLFGRDGNDRLVGGDGGDTLYGENGDDSLHGSDGDDTLYGGAGSDNLQGGEGADVMDGGPGPDDTGATEGADDHDVASFLEIGPEFDEATKTYTSTGLTIQGSDVAGFDYKTNQGDLIVRVEEIVGTNYDDLMTGTAGDDYYVGARGEDSISGDAGDDMLYGSLDDDQIDADEGTGAGSDTLVFLRYNTDGDDATADPDAKGDGNDIVANFDVANDSLQFLGDESVIGILDWDVVGNDTIITYASESTITLQGIVISDLSELTITESIDPDLFA